MKTKLLLLLFFLCFFLGSEAQLERKVTFNTIGWYNVFPTLQFTKKLSLHTEYQFRRSEVMKEWQQSLLRVGLNYQVHPSVQFRVGYGWIETYPYGEIPLNSMGKQFTEHRIFQAITIKDKIERVDLSHRFMLEQRWVGSYSNANLKKEDTYTLLHRVRYMFRAQIPLIGKEIKTKTPYFAVYDEVFIGFGKHVKENIFDQNRIAVLLGYQVNPSIKIEAGYLNQIVQYAREINQQNVFQHNNGIIVNANFLLDVSKN